MKILRPLPLALLAAGLCASPLRADPNLFGTDKKKVTTDAQRASSTHRKHGPGLLDKLWSKVHPAPAAGSAAATAAVEREIGKSHVMLSMSIDPQPLKLAEARQLKVTLHVSNREKKMVQLEFPTTQRVEVLVKDAAGKLVEQWSEDHTFANEPGMVSINPGEHLEYTAALSTRDMAAGQTYTIEALFPQYETLRLQQNVTPEK